MEQTTTPHKKAPWIVVTGMNGAGTTTLQENLAKSISGRVKSFHVGYSKFIYPTIREIAHWKQQDPDGYTERLLFALDARLTNAHIKKWMMQYDILISARGWPDNFFYGASQRFSYEETAKLLRLDDFEKPSVIVFLTCDVKVAIDRIENSIKQLNKKLPYESAEFLERLKTEIRQFVTSLEQQKSGTSWFTEIPMIHIDTTKLSSQEVFRLAESFLRSRQIFPDGRL